MFCLAQLRFPLSQSSGEHKLVRVSIQVQIHFCSNFLAISTSLDGQAITTILNFNGSVLNGIHVLK